jgi:hypothetical protein
LNWRGSSNERENNFDTEGADEIRKRLIRHQVRFLLPRLWQIVFPKKGLSMSDAHDHAHKHDEHCGHDHHDHDHEEHEHGLVEVVIELEDEHIPALDQVAAEITKELKQPWDRGAVVRLALSEFFSRRGMIT